MSRQYTIHEETPTIGNPVYWLYYGEERVTEVFLKTKEETERQFEDGTYTVVGDLTAFENLTEEPPEDFFLTQEGVEKYRRTTELLPDEAAVEEERLPEREFLTEK